MRSFFVWTIFLCLFGLPTVAQTTVQNPPHRFDVAPSDDDDAHSRIVAEQAKKAAKDRVAALKQDTDKLLKLSVELKESVDKSSENVLSLDVIKKAEEIEKLAHSVKEKMKGPN